MEINQSESFENLAKRLDVIISILIKEREDEMTITAGVSLLKSFGLSNSEIANILGTTKRTVEVTSSRLRKQG
jgi:transcriptional regulator